MKPPAFTFVCDEPWDSMAGTERVRRCARCDRDVHALAAHSRAEVTSLLSGSQRVCAQVATWDGRLLTAARVVVAAAALAGGATPAAAADWTVGPAHSEARLGDSGVARTLVVTTQTGSRAARVGVSVVAADGLVVAAVTTDEAGVAALPDLAPGTYTFRVERPLRTVAYVADLSAERVDLVLLSNARPEVRGGDLKLGRPRVDRSTENLSADVERLRALRANCPASATEAIALADLVLEQAEAVLAEEDVSMYADLLTFVDDAVEQLVAAGCEPAPAPPPAP